MLCKFINMHSHCLIMHQDQGDNGGHSPPLEYICINGFQKISYLNAKNIIRFRRNEKKNYFIINSSLYCSWVELQKRNCTFSDSFVTKILVIQLQKTEKLFGQLIKK